MQLKKNKYRNTNNMSAEDTEETTTAFIKKKIHKGIIEQRKECNVDKKELEQINNIESTNTQKILCTMHK